MGEIAGRDQQIANQMDTGAWSRDMMSNCCAGGAVALARSQGPEADFQTFVAADPEAFVFQDEEGNNLLHMLVENMHCANCIRSIEKALKSLDGVLDARVNFSTRRLLVRWQAGSGAAADLVRPVIDLGYFLTPYNPEMMRSAAAEEEKKLLRALGVAGFAATNVMLLSVAVWAGLFSEDMGPATRDLMHWFSALIALPAVAYAGQPFFRSALAALKNGRLNMDVPISLAVVLASGMSLSETIQSGEYAYFDASVTLLFFLLIGRYLDMRARGKARSAAERLLLLKAVAATVVLPDGSHKSIPVEAVTPGTIVHVPAGERIPVDGEIIEGRTAVDNSLVTGESLPVEAAKGDAVFAGTLNLNGAVRLRAIKTGDNTLLSDIVRLMENAEQGRAKYVRIADRVAEYYAPAVHLLAAVTFVGWWILGFDWQVALIQAVAVLIITCPCALGLAVPVVQVVASGRLLQRGVLVKAADGLERLAKVDTVVFDKTGTLTEGRLDLINEESIDRADLDFAASIARNSKHPLALAVARRGRAVHAMADVTEHPGRGLSVVLKDGEVRLGSREWCGVPADFKDANDPQEGPELWFAQPGRQPIRFLFEDCLRHDAVETIAALKKAGLQVELLSGDRAPVAEKVAATIGIDDWQAGVKPEQKTARLEELKAAGRTVLMVGDGLNDAPALAMAHVSMSPSTAADVSQTAADFVFQGRGLGAVLEAVRVARFSHRLVIQNFGLAFLYNAIAVPLAIAGFVTPLFAAIAMSASSLVVCFNSMRLIERRKGETQ
ncbi:cation-translocating P-type ATPase [Sneathiella chinensis]|uniref:Copper-translocating P-type ATPase n=1 Tax=Sneathiella chinensis TaxID=349750 RepID=A0ABQ5U1C0_9PROT|nr:cation-translocating P-type ATPase [Sneathiella chinensis]GLQ05987.1 copper-translocating P-type ATPase [Sneathiella chinensis]